MAATGGWIFPIMPISQGLELEHNLVLGGSRTIIKVPIPESLESLSLSQKIHRYVGPAYVEGVDGWGLLEI